VVDLIRSSNRSTEEYNGTSWTTSPGSLNTARRSLAGAGTQTAALAFGGYDSTSTPLVIQVQQKNMMVQVGQQWKFKYSKKDLAGGGYIQTSALAFGGDLDT
jgi:hypothetical protein